MRIFLGILVGFGLIIWSDASLASSYVMFTNQNSTSTEGNETNTMEAFLSSESKDKTLPKTSFYSLDLSTQEIYTPTSYTAIAVPHTNDTSVAFNTTLYTNVYNILYEYHTPSKWTFGAGYDYSRQQASGTPNVFSQQMEVDLSHSMEYGKTAKAKSDSDDFVPEWEWKLTASYGPIQADSFALPVRTRLGVLTIYPEGEQELNQTGLELTLSVDPVEWLTASGSYESYSYDSDPNNFALLKSPKAGLPTSLNAYETGVDLTFHLSDDWDFEAKTMYAVAATIDQSISIENTFLLTYAFTTFEVSGGYDQLMYSNVADVDSSVVALRFLF